MGVRIRYHVKCMDSLNYGNECVFGEMSDELLHGRCCKKKLKLPISKIIWFLFFVFVLYKIILRRLMNLRLHRNRSFVFFHSICLLLLDPCYK